MTNTESIYWHKHHDDYGRSAQALSVDGYTYAVAVRLPGGHPDGLPVLVNLWIIPTYVDGLKVVSPVQITYHRTMQSAKKWAQETVRGLRLTPADLSDATRDQLFAAWYLTGREAQKAVSLLNTLDRMGVEETSVSRVEPTKLAREWANRQLAITLNIRERLAA